MRFNLMTSHRFNRPRSFGYGACQTVASFLLSSNGLLLMALCLLLPVSPADGFEVGFRALAFLCRLSATEHFTYLLLTISSMVLCWWRLFFFLCSILVWSASFLLRDRLSLSSQVCEKLGLTGGAPLFSFQYTDKKANETFLKLDKKVLSQDLNKKEVPKQLSFKAKFFPESVGDELLDPVMQRLFWKQIRAGIVEDTIYCPPELCVLFAAQAVQFEHGDFAPENAGKVVASVRPQEQHSCVVVS